MLPNPSPITSAPLGTEHADGTFMGKPCQRIVIVVGKKQEVALPEESDAAGVVEAARVTNEALVISATPDVCKTPMGSATPPVPYNIVAMLGEDAATTPSVRFRRELRAYTTKSHTTCCHGDEAGTATGVMSGTVGSICEPKTHSLKVRAEGNWVVRDGDEFWMNSRNTTGFLHYSGDDGKYWPHERIAHPETEAEERALIEQALAHPNHEIVYVDQVKNGWLEVREFAGDSEKDITLPLNPQLFKREELDFMSIIALYYVSQQKEDANFIQIRGNSGHHQALNSAYRGTQRNTPNSSRVPPYRQDQMRRFEFEQYLLRTYPSSRASKPRSFPNTEIGPTPRPGDEFRPLVRPPLRSPRLPADGPLCEPAAPKLELPSPPLLLDSNISIDAVINMALRISNKGETRRKNSVCEPSKAKEYVLGFEVPKAWRARSQNIAAHIVAARLDPSFGNGSDKKRSPAEYQIFQWEKCGYPEYKIKNSLFSKKPIADGVSPDVCPQEPRLGCLILEAKYSRTKSAYYSPYGYEDNRPVPDPASKLELHRKYAFPDQKSASEGLFPVSEEDAKREDDQVQSEEVKPDQLWEKIRIRTAQQMALYYLICLDPDIPYNDFVVIYNRDFMHQYFKNLIPLPPGYLIGKETTLGDGKIWAP